MSKQFCICKLYGTINVSIYFPLGFNKKFSFHRLQIRPFLPSPCLFLYLHSNTIFCRLGPDSRNVPSNTRSAGMIRMAFCLVTGFLMFKSAKISHRGKRRIALWIIYFLAWSFSCSYFCFPDDFNEHLCNISTDFNGTDVTRFWKISWNVSSCFVFFHNWADTTV